MKILIVDDAPEVVESVQLNFMLNWPEAEVISAGDGKTALDLVRRESPDMVLLDIGLPKDDGFTVLQRLRETSNVPVVMLTARDGTEEKVRGLQLGADDYVTKPFNHLELIERIRAVLRRVEMTRSVGPTVRLDGFEMDFERQEVRVDGRLVRLTPTEYNLLHHLVTHRGVVQRHEAILKAVWGLEYEDEVDYLRVYVRRIREKLRDDPERPRYIATERGYGYRFAAAESAVT